MCSLKIGGINRYRFLVVSGDFEGLLDIDVGIDVFYFLKGEEALVWTYFSYGVFMLLVSYSLVFLYRLVFERCVSFGFLGLRWGAVSKFLGIRSGICLVVWYGGYRGDSLFFF